MRQDVYESDNTQGWNLPHTSIAMKTNDLGTRMKLAMVAVNRDQKEVAEKLGWDPSTLSNYVNGHQVPGGMKLQAFVKELGVDGHWLLMGEGDPYPIPREAKERAFMEISAIVDRVRAEHDATRPDATTREELERFGRRQVPRGPREDC